MQTEGLAAVFSTDFLPYSQTFVYDEIRSHERYAVDVFCKQRLNTSRFPYDNTYQPGGALGRLFYENMAYWPAFDRILAQKKHDLIHAHFGTGAVYALPYVKKYKYPFIVTFWGNDVGALIGPQRRKPARWRYVLAAPRIMKAADLMLCVSQELCDFVAELSGRPEAVRLYHQGVDLSLFSQGLDSNPNPGASSGAESSEEVRLILIGRFTEKKGHKYALKAFDQVLKAGRNAKLVLVGSGPLMEECATFVTTNGMDDSVIFTGTLTQEETARELARSQIALVPSVVAQDQDREGSPTVIREASASALPVIGTVHAGIPEIIDDGRTGFLVPERDVLALSDRMITLIDDAEMRDAFGRAGRRKMETEFDVKKQVAVLEQHYDFVRQMHENV